MPTRRITEKSAALEGVKKLHEAGGLNEHLKPVVKDILDSDEEDDVKVEESRINHAGTEKRGQYYPNEVGFLLFTYMTLFTWITYIVVYFHGVMHDGCLYGTGGTMSE